VVAAAIEDGKAIAGGGSAEIELSIRAEGLCATVGGREQLAIEAFAGALDVILGRSVRMPGSTRSTFSSSSGRSTRRRAQVDGRERADGRTP